MKVDPALAAMVEVLKACRERATEKLRQDPDFAAKQPYMQAANAELPAAERYVIAKPADFGDFIVKEYLLTARRPSEGIDEVFTSLGAGETLPDGANSRRLEIEAGVLAISGGVPLGFPLSWQINTGIFLLVTAVASGFLALGVLKKSQPADLLR